MDRIIGRTPNTKNNCTKKLYPQKKLNKDPGETASQTWTQAPFEWSVFEVRCNSSYKWDCTRHTTVNSLCKAKQLLQVVPISVCFFKKINLKSIRAYIFPSTALSRSLLSHSESDRCSLARSLMREPSFCFLLLADLSEVWWMWVDLSHVGVLSLCCVKWRQKKRSGWEDCDFYLWSAKMFLSATRGGSGREIRAVEEQK